MKRWSLISMISIILLLLADEAFAKAPSPDHTRELRPVSVQNMTITGTGMEMTLQLARPDWFEVGKSENRVVVSEIRSGGTLEIEGFPLVPVAGTMFRLPPRSGVSIVIIESEYETFTDIDYAVFTGSDNPEDFIRAQQTEDNWFPGILAEVGEPAILHDFRVGNLVTYPVQVNTARREARVYSSIQVAIHYEGIDERNTIPYWPTSISETFLPWYRTFLDWNENELDEYTLYRGAVKVVVRNDVLALDEVQQWVEWKLQRGWELDFLTEDDANWTAGGIKSELQSRWDDSDPKFDYILVIGDASGPYNVPPGMGYGDHEYCRLAGDDILIDCAHGRISVETVEQVATYVNKVFAYERDPNMGNTDWYLKGTMTATSSASGMSTVYLGRYARDAMLNLGFADAEVYAYNDGGGGVNSRGIQDLNSGVSMYGHRGWLNTGLSDIQINNLNNDFMTPVVLDITCNTGDWTWSGTNEAWMRAGNVNSPRGGIVAMGMHTSGTHTRFNNCLTGGGWYSILVQQNPTVGQALFAAKYNLFINFDANAHNDVANFSQWCNMMGDPLVYIWTGVPRLLEVTAQGALELGENSYSVTVQDDETGELIEGAWVTLYKVDENEEIIVRSETGPNGQATLYAPFRFTGQVILTVSQQHYAPYQLEVSVFAPDDRVGHFDITYQDDGDDGTDGNGNGVPEAGETVGLVITAKNYGLSNQTGIVATASCDDDAITGITGTADLGNIPAGETGQANSLILIEINPEAQHDWIIHLELEFSSDQGTYTDGFQLTVNAVQFAMVQVEIEDNIIEPGQQANISVTVANVGGSDAEGISDAVLQINDEFLFVIQDAATFPQMIIGEEGTSTDFTVQAHTMAFPGHIASAALIITTPGAQVDTVYLNIPVGQRTSTDPTGPDVYGYYAYDDTDTDYDELVPEYEWIEINPAVPEHDFEGTSLELNDSGNNVDDSEVIDLPFPVQYYGETFNQMTVSANGFVSMGDQADLLTPRNWTIPSPLGPNYMIAPYWDERLTSGQNNVYYHHDEPGGRIIVEWYHVTDVSGNNPCTFELVVYSLQEGHDTWTGDNEILFQYNDMNHSAGAWSDVPYFTTGIENGDQSDGVLISYWNSASPGSAPIEDERAYLITTNRNRITGFLEGTVTDFNTGNALEGVAVRLLESGAAYLTNAQGYYSMEIQRGTYTVVVDFDPYAHFEQTDVQIDSAETTVVDIALRVGLFQVIPEVLEVTLTEEGAEDHLLTVSNVGSAEFEVQLEMLPVIELNDSMDIVSTFNPTELSGDSWINGMAYGDNTFFVSGANNWSNPNYIYKFGFNGEYLGSFEQPGSNLPGADAQGMRDLAYDGNLLYGGVENDIIVMDPETGIEVRSFAGPHNPNQAMAYDPERDLLWVTRNLRDIVGVDKQTGVEIERIAAGLYVDALTYWPGEPEGYTIYMSARELNGGRRNIYKVNPEIHDIAWSAELPDHDDSDATLKGMALIQQFNVYYNAIAALMTTNEWGVMVVRELNMQIPYATFTPDHFFVPSESQVEVTVSLMSAGLDNGQYQSNIYAEHNTAEELTVIPVILTLVVPGENGNALPDKYALHEPYPNPFNNSCVISFDLPRENLVRLVVYDLLGKETAVLQQEKYGPGSYRINFDGTGLASGIYFVRMEAGNDFMKVAKIMLIK